MKHIKHILLIGIFALITLASCDKDVPFDSNPTEKVEEGSVSFSSLSIEVSNSENIIARSSVDISNYIVEILNTSTNAIAGTWKYSEMPEIVTLPVGDYKAIVKSHVVKAAAWEEPYFYGDKTFSIVKDSVQDVGLITCKLQNVKVTIQYDEELLKVLGTDAKVNVVVGDKGTLDFAYNETRPGYFEFVSSNTTLVATFSGTVDGSKETGYKIFVDIKAGQHRIITYTLKDSPSGPPDEFGEINGPSLVVNAQIKTIDLTYNVPADEETVEPDPTPNPDPDPDPDPDPKPDENTPTITSTSLNLSGVNNIASGMTADVDIVAKNGIKNLQVEIISESLSPEILTGVGLADKFDLVNPGDLKVGLESLGFKTGAEIEGKTSLKFDISEFMGLLINFAGNHQFKITVIDAKGLKTTASLNFLAQ